MLCWSAEGCCSEHVGERVELLKHDALESWFPLPKPDLASAEWPYCVGWGRKTLKNFLVRVLPASEVESEILAHYGLARLDLNEFERTIKDKGYDHTRPISRETQIARDVRKNSVVPKPLEPTPSSQMHGLAKVAGMHALKNLLKKEVVRPFLDPRPFRRYGLTIPNGILLYGPPGCGKTYIARQLAEELGFSFVELIPSEVASPYIHGSVSLIREVFEKAEKQAPSVLFIDEFEALVPSRADLGGHQQYKSEEVNEFLAHMNDCATKGVLVMAATNEPRKIDAAVLRTGRLDKHIYVGPPDEEARKEMLALHLGGRHFDPGLDIAGIASRLEGYSASDIKFIVDEAARDAMENDQPISTQQIESAKRRVPPSVTEENVQRYLAFHTRGAST